jgi:hypothetical protein
MQKSSKKVDVYLELAAKRTFAGAFDWPGWCRSGRDETSALQALLDYAPRYAIVMRLAHLRFDPPAELASLTVVERLKGDSTTDFGAPGGIPASDTGAMDEAELQRLRSMLKACRRVFDETVEAARHRTLRSGPRGGGRDLAKMVGHVLEAQRAYVAKLGWKAPLDATQARNVRRSPNNEGQWGVPAHILATGAEKAVIGYMWGSINEDQWNAALEALSASARGELPTRGPRGGLHWPPRYFVRRAAWHVLDHTWEIEDRLTQ